MWSNTLRGNPRGSIVCTFFKSHREIDDFFVIIKYKVEIIVKLSDILILIIKCIIFFSLVIFAIKLFFVISSLIIRVLLIVLLITIILYVISKMIK